MSSEFPSLPAGFKAVKLLGSRGLFRTILCSESAPQGVNAYYVFRTLQPIAASDRRRSLSIQEFFGRYKEITNWKHLPKFLGLSGGQETEILIKEEFVPGTPLSKLVSNSADPDPLDLLIQICEALHAAHMKKVYHLCISADRIIVSKNMKRAHLVGFGTAAMVEHINLLTPGQKELLAPEIIARSNPQANSDIFSLAMMIRRLYPGKESDPLLAQATAHDPNDRIRKAREFGNELEKVFSGKVGKSVPSPTRVLNTKRVSGGLKPKLTLRTKPDGAKIIIGQKTVGITSKSGLAVPWDKGIIIIQKQHYQTAHISYSDSPINFNVLVELKPIETRVRFLTDPAGALVIVDGKSCGETDYKGLLAILRLGQHQVRLSKPGYRDKSFPIKLETARPVKLGPVKLEAQPLRIITEPAGASINVGERYYGLTDQDGIVAPWNEGPIVIHKAGFQHKTLNISTPPANTVVRVQLTMDKLASGLTRESLQSDSELDRDGLQPSSGPSTFQCPHCLLPMALVENRCPNCGRKPEDETNAQTATASDADPTDNITRSSSDSVLSPGGFWLVLGVLAAVIGAGILFWAYGFLDMVRLSRPGVIQKSYISWAHALVWISFFVSLSGLLVSLYGFYWSIQWKGYKSSESMIIAAVPFTIIGGVMLYRSLERAATSLQYPKGATDALMNTLFPIFPMIIGAIIVPLLNGLLNLFIPRRS